MIAGLIALVGGIAALAWASDQFVIGAARVALLRNVPALVVGVVIVGFGTSAPELLVSVLATLDDETAVAVANVVGSNLANLTLLLGIGAVIVPIGVSSRTVRVEAPLVVGATIVFGLAIQGGLQRWEGAAMLATMVIALYVMARPALRKAVAAVDGDVAGGGDGRAVAGGAGGAATDGVDGQSAVHAEEQIGIDVEEFLDAGQHRLSREVIRTVIGLVGTLGAANVLLWGALRLADEAGLSGGFVGVTLVAIGTSLPELVTVIQSARRRETDLIVGNLLGSNLFNALVVGGTVGLIGGPPVTERSLTVVAAVAAVVAASVAALAMFTRHTVSRREGIVLIVAYVATIPFLT